MASDGDVRVLLVLDLLLSAVFAYTVLTAMDFAGIREFTRRGFVVTTLFLAAVTYLAVLRQ